jgi:hypothetical protein
MKRARTGALRPVAAEALRQLRRDLGGPWPAAHGVSAQYVGAPDPLFAGCRRVCVLSFHRFLDKTGNADISL